MRVNGEYSAPLVLIHSSHVCDMVAAGCVKVKRAIRYGITVPCLRYLTEVAICPEQRVRCDHGTIMPAGLPSLCRIGTRSYLPHADLVTAKYKHALVEVFLVSKGRPGPYPAPAAPLQLSSQLSPSFLHQARHG